MWCIVNEENRDPEASKGRQSLLEKFAPAYMLVAIWKIDSQDGL